MLNCMSQRNDSLLSPPRERTKPALSVANGVRGHNAQVDHPFALALHPRPLPSRERGYGVTLISAAEN